MSNPRLVLAAFATVIVLAACSSAPVIMDEGPPPGPTAEELEAMRQDSIRRVEAAAEEQRRREAAATDAEMQRRAEAVRRTLGEMVFFDYDEAAIRSDAEAILRSKLDILRNNPGVQLLMEGHADERGTSEYNIALGNERAEAVIQWLAGFGLDAGRFSSVSYGEERPLAQGSSEMDWARNRRVEFVITGGGDNIGQ